MGSSIHSPMLTRSGYKPRDTDSFRYNLDLIILNSRSIGDYGAAITRNPQNTEGHLDAIGFLLPIVISSYNKALTAHKESLKKPKVYGYTEI